MAFIPLGVIGPGTQNVRRALVTSLSAVGVLTYFAFPNQVSLFGAYLLIWWIGVELSDELVATSRITFRGQAPMVGVLAFIVFAWCVGSIMIDAPGLDRLTLGIFPVLQIRHFAAALVFSLAAIVLWRKLIAPASSLIRPFVAIAPISYFLYATHKPLLDIVGGLFDGAHRLIVALIAFVATVSLGWLVERTRKFTGNVTAASAKA